MNYRDTREIYLDANATTPVLPLAAEEAHQAMEQLYGNPSSSHITGLRARFILESARNLAKSVLGVNSGRIVFTSGATEAIETAVFSTLCHLKAERSARGSGSSERRLLLYGSTEHKAVPLALNHWNQLLDVDADVVEIPVDERGLLNLEFLQARIHTADMVCTMAVNNETGVIQDLPAIEQILELASRPIAWMVDCVQAVAKLDLNLETTRIDFAPISGHKLYAPKGIGMLYVREGVPLTPLLAGGGQEGGARGGTENLPGVAAFAAVLERLVEHDESVFRNRETLVAFRDSLVTSLQTAFPRIVFNTPFEHSVATTINFSVPGISSKEILDLFDAAGIRVSSGSACGSAIQGSYVLEAMGLPKWRSEGAIRVSFGPCTTELEVQNACYRIEQAGRAIRDSCLIVSHNVDVSTGTPLDGLIQLKKGSMCTWMIMDADTRHCLVIDPFEDFLERIESLVRCQNSRVLAVLDTHNHVDHDSPRELLLRALGDSVVAPTRSTDLLGWPAEDDGFIELGIGEPARILQFAEELVLARTDLGGHTVDSQVFLLGRARDGRLAPGDIRFAFPGDTIQIGGIGRTDFPSSAPEAMYSSLRKLPGLITRSTVICPTHDYVNGFCTTLECEDQANTLLARILDPAVPLSLPEFLAEKSRIDSEITDETNCELVCGNIQPYDGERSSIDMRPSQLKEFFENHRHWQIIDVREPHEFKFSQDWDELGLKEPPRNIPLTRISNCLPDLLAKSRETGSDIIFLCRSGNRSGKAAELLRRMGVSNAWHIAGGIALGTTHSGAQQDDEMEYII